MYFFETSGPYADAASSVDLKFHFCGTFDCDTGRSKGPAIREHFQLCYLQEGRGVLTLGSQDHDLTSPCCFLVPPGLSAWYRPVGEAAWNYHWVAFSGLNAGPWLKRTGLTVEFPCVGVRSPETIQSEFERLYASSRNSSSGDLRLLAGLVSLLAHLVDSAPSRPHERNSPPYVAKAVEWLGLNYGRDITIAELGRYLGLDVRYFSRVFKAEMKNSPQGFLIQLRMDRARGLLNDPHRSVAEVARSVGYEDPLLFSKMFKKTVGVSPVQYRAR